VAAHPTFMDLVSLRYSNEQALAMAMMDTGPAEGLTLDFEEVKLPNGPDEDLDCSQDAKAWLVKVLPPWTHATAPSLSLNCSCQTSWRTGGRPWARPTANWAAYEYTSEWHRSLCRGN
jgi:hypothetical protein